MRRTWHNKFRDAFRGLGVGIRGQSSFAVHVVMATAVGILAAVVRVSLIEACVLGLCVVAVLAAELFNTAIERLADAVDEDQNPHIADALDISSAAVLVASLGAAVVGGAIFLYRLGVLLEWWQA